jgi:glycosyltransferase involved in cell wall biosynthesis
MKIFVVHNSYIFPGGEDNVYSLEKKLLREHGHTVVEYLDTNKRIESLGKIDSAIQTIWSKPSFSAIKKILQETKPDIVHFHNTFLMISPSAYYACAELHIPVVQTLHNYRLICPNAYLFRDGSVCEECINRSFPLPAVRYGCYRNSRSQSAVVATMLGFHRLIHTWQKKVDCFIALTEFARGKFIQGGIPEEKIVIKPNFAIDTKEFHVESSKKFVLFVGHLSPEKGLDILLSAWNSLEIPLKIAGDGPLADLIGAMAGKSTTIEYLGSVSHSKVMELLSQAAFLVFPSKLYEGLPMTIIEAFAAGIPVIASNSGPRAEIISDSNTGLLYDPDNPSDLSSRVNWLWNHTEERTEMGKNARRDYEKKYTPEKNYQMLMNIYEKIL